MELIKKHYKKVLFLIIYLILGYWMIKYTFNYFEDLNSFNSREFLLFVLGGIIVVIITMLILVRYNRDNIAKQFVVIAIIWGTAFALFNPPFLVPDEVVHINRAYDLAKGRIFYKAHKNSMMLPVGMRNYDQNICDIINENEMGKYLEIAGTELEKDTLVKYDASPTGAYSFISYIPQAIGTFIGDLLNLPSYFVLILGRIANLSVWILFGYLSLKYIPIKKSLLFLIMFLPVGIQQAASYSPDAILNSASFLVISYILYLKFEKEQTNYKDWLIIIGLTILIGAVKLPYILISGTLILIPNKKVRFGVFGKLLVLFLILAINIGATIGWKILSKPRVVDVPKVTITGSIDSSINKEKVNWVNEIVENPNMFVNKIKDTREDMEEFYKKSFTAYLGWFEVEPTIEFAELIIAVLFLFAIFGDCGKYILGIFDRFIYVLMAIGMYVLLCVVSFQWANSTLADLRIFDGIQGRYFYPFIIGIYMIFQNNILKIKNSELFINTYRNLYVCWTLMFALSMVMNRYFV